MKSRIIVSILVLAVAAFLIGSAAAKPDTRAWLGVYTQRVDKDLAKAFDLQINYGAIVNSVVDNSPAEKAGIKEDDIIIALDGNRITDDDELQDLIWESKPDDEVTIALMRDGKRMEVKAKLDRYSSRHRDDEWSERNYRSSWDKWPYRVQVLRDKEYSYIGVVLTDISKDAAASFGADDGGVLVNRVEEDSPAESVGLKPGDLIVKVDGDNVVRSSEVSRKIRAFDKGDKVKIDVVRDHKPLGFEVEVSTHKLAGLTRDLDIPDIPDIDLNIPRMHGLHWLNYDDRMFDSDEFKEEMNELRREMDQLRLELNELRKDKD